MIKNFLYQNKLLLKNLVKNFGLAILFGLLVLGFSVLMSHLLYQPKKMVKRGFEIEIKVLTQNIDGVKVGNLGDIKPSVKVKVIDIAAMIKNADIDAGAKVFRKCITCHSVKKNGTNKIGPNLYGIIGKKKASIAGFAYSPALKAKGGSWTIKDLNQWLKKPRDFAPGTKMGFAGLRKDKDRANVIAYLKQQGK